jgi:hypothetical protein
MIGADPQLFSTYFSTILLSSGVYLVAATAGGLARLRNW